MSKWDQFKENAKGTHVSAFEEIAMENAFNRSIVEDDVSALEEVANGKSFQLYHCGR